jgi:hypothetical protein
MEMYIVTAGLLVRIEAKPGRSEIERFPLSSH